ISQKEYYQFFAFLNNADEPAIEVSDASARGRRKELETEVARREADLANHFPVPADASKKDDRPVDIRRREALEQRFGEWLRQERARASRWTVLRPVSAKGSLPLLTIQSDDSVLASGDQSKSDTYELTFRTDMKDITAVRLEVLPDERLPQRGPGRIYYEG